MELSSEWPCWKIMQCKCPENCLAYQHPHKKCWDIASETENFRSTFNICRDCIVFLIKHERSILPDQEIEAILKNRGSCILAR